MQTDWTNSNTSVMAKNKTILLSDLFLFATERFITPNESSTFKNVFVYHRDVDNPSRVRRYFGFSSVTMQTYSLMLMFCLGVSLSKLFLTFVVYRYVPLPFPFSWKHRFAQSFACLSVSLFTGVTARLMRSESRAEKN